MTTISVENTLDTPISLYDSYSGSGTKTGAASDSTDSDGTQSYYGTLTLIDQIAPGETKEFDREHGLIETLIAFDTHGHPVARLTSMFDTVSFHITDADVQTMSLAQQFVTEITQTPDGALAKNFKAIKDDEKGAYVSNVDAFFQATTDFKAVTFATYMLALTDQARNPAKTPNLPIEQQPYSIKMLVNHLGGVWPDAFPDILVTHFKYQEKDGVIAIRGLLDFVNLPFENSDVGKNIMSIVPINEVEVEFMMNANVGLAALATRMKFIAPDFHIPDGDGTVTIAHPTVSLDVVPLFEFVVFSASADIPFDVFQKAFDAGINMTIDNVEMAVGATLSADTGLQAPAPIKGIVLDEFGLNMGALFEPPSVALGLEGKFHIGSDNNVVALDDDTFALVCTFEAEAEGMPNPVYLAFNLPSLDFSTFLEIFTDVSMPLDLPVKLEDLSMRWSENPMEPVVLPDGSLTQMGYGFSGYLEVLSFRFFGEVEIGGHGVQGTIECSPITAGSVFSLTGNGKGVTRKVDAKGNIINNTLIPSSKQVKQAIADAKSVQIVPPGGPELTVNSGGSPYFTLGFDVSLLGQTLESVNAEVSSKGIAFDLDYGAVLSTKMSCTLKDYHNLSSSFGFGIDKSISLPSLFGFHLGTLPLKAMVNAALGVQTSTQDVVVTASAGLTFEGISANTGTLTLDASISKIEDVLSALEAEIVDNAAHWFGALFSDAESWASHAKDEVIEGFNDAKQIAQGLRQAFQQDAHQAAQTFQSLGYDVQEAGPAILNVFSDGAQTAASAIAGVFSPAPDEMKALLEGAGLTASEVGNILKSLGGAFSSLGNDILNGLSKLDPRHW